MNKDVVIIGAGLTGLTTAFYAKQKGLNVIVIEKNNYPGGVIQSVYEEGFTFEKGPNTGVIAHPEVAELFEALTPKCHLETANPEAKKRLIWKANQWNALPAGLKEAIKTPLFSTKDKFNILLEPFKRKGKNPNESLAQLVKRRLGQSYLDFAVDPFVSGIYAGDANTLVTRFALPKLYNLEQEHGSFIRGGVAKAFSKKSDREKKATREVFSAQGGLGNLTKALAQSIGNECILLSCSNTKIEKSNEGFIVTTNNGTLHSFNSKQVVTTTDASTLPDLLPFIQPIELQPIISLRYAKVAQVIMGFKKWSGTSVKAFGGLVPSVEERSILGVLFTSSFLANRAPQEGALLSVFVGGIKHEDIYNLNDDALLEVVKNEVKTMMDLPTITPDILHLFRYPRAIPQYEASTAARLAAINSIQKQHAGLYLAGAIRDGIGMADRIKQATSIVNQLV